VLDPALIGAKETFTGLSPSMATLSSAFKLSRRISKRSRTVKANDPLSLATTYGISVDFFSLGLLRCFSSPSFYCFNLFLLGGDLWEIAA